MRQPGVFGLLAAMLVAGWAGPLAAAARTTCTAALGAPALRRGPLPVRGLEPVTADLAVLPGHTYLIEVDERDNDVVLEALAGNDVLARAVRPERRAGKRRAVVAVPEAGSLTVRLTGREHARASGTATVRVFDMAVLAGRPECFDALRTLAEADADYAKGDEVARGHAEDRSASARAAFLRAAQSYARAAQLMEAAGDELLRGDAALALAELEYLDLQEWAKAAAVARVAADAFGERDPYARARAQAVMAAAWIEIGLSGAGVAGGGRASSGGGLLARARGVLERLARFHEQRGERYDAGLQLTDISLSYLYEGRYLECVGASRAAARAFAAIDEMPRRAQAWQNQALCLWGLGRLPEALRWFQRALQEIGPEPYPWNYLGTLNNAALANYAAGRFDEALRLFDRSLAFSRETQARRDEAQSLYGIGVTYYALGDRDRAREFLERSLAIRSAALDGRGRMSTLRALATIDAEQGRVESAIASDREALALALAPSAIARIRIQLAVHTAAAGRLPEAKGQLDDVIAALARADPLIRAEALLERAVLLRGMGRPREALADLSAARPALAARGSAAERFEADLERARSLRLLGERQPALAALDRALKQSDAMRLQTANPELRAQLQAPLRPAYDLKLALLRERYEEAQSAGREAEVEELAAAAFKSADASRARSLADLAAQRYPADVRRALASALQRREALYRELSARRFALDARVDRSGSEDPRAKHLVSDIAELGRQADALNTLIARTAHRASIVRAAAGAVALPEVAPDTALISYWLGSEAAYAWVLARGELHWVGLAPPREIAARAAAFHRSLRRLVDTSVERRLEDAGELYEAVLKPIDSWVSGVREWVVIPDGALDYIPFAALRPAQGGPDEFVVMRHDVAFTPAAWLFEAAPASARESERGGLLLVADPVYQADDPRLASLSPTPPSRASADGAGDLPGGDYRRLAFTAEEAAQIRAQFPPTDVEALIGLDATRERLLALDLSRYRFIHIATHGIVDAQVPQLSALVLGSYDARGRRVEGAVRVADLSLKTLTADVAVLSACDTALGKEVLSEGLVGVGSTLLARGARAVVASLWPVSDEIGARLMTDLYRHLLRDSMNAPAALGASMRSLVSRDGSADPALWGAFQVSVVALGSGLPKHNPATANVAATSRPGEMP